MFAAFPQETGLWTPITLCINKHSKGSGQRTLAVRVEGDIIHIKFAHFPGMKLSVEVYYIIFRQTRGLINLKIIDQFKMEAETG